MIKCICWTKKFIHSSVESWLKPLRSHHQNIIRTFKGVKLRQPHLHCNFDLFELYIFLKHSKRAAQRSKKRKGRFAVTPQIYKPSPDVSCMFVGIVTGKKAQPWEFKSGSPKRRLLKVTVKRIVMKQSYDNFDDDTQTCWGVCEGEQPNKNIRVRPGQAFTHQLSLLYVYVQILIAASQGAEVAMQPLAHLHLTATTGYNQWRATIVEF